MPQARPLLFSAALLALVLPGHPLALLTGLPLGVPAIVVAVLLAGWWLVLPGRPPRAGLLLGAICLLAVLKVGLWALAPGYGLDAAYRAEATPVAAPTLSKAPDVVRVDSTLDLEGDAFPVHFFNDIRRFNYYTANDPKRDLLPFSVVWTGQVVAPRSGRYIFALEANGPATIEVGGARANVERGGRLRDASLAVDLPAGLAPITVTYARPEEAMPWLGVRVARDGEPESILAAPLVVRSGVSADSVARDAWLRPLALTVDIALLAVLAIGFLVHLISSWREDGVRSRRSPLRGTGLSVWERVLLAAYAVVGVGRELLAQLHLQDRAVILSGGNDWLAYESYARDVFLNGPLMTEGRALGQGAPFYYQPLYIYWVALTHAVLGESLFAPLFMNAVLGIVAGLLLFLLTRELFGRAAAIAALVLFEAYRETVFAPTSGLLLSENLLIPLVPLFLLLLARAARTGQARYFVAAGVALGLAGLTRTTPLALLPPALLVLAFAMRRAGIGWRGTAVRLAALVLACLATISPATIRNEVVAGRLVPITSSAGANLWETHRPSSKVDLSRIDRDPLYERLGLDRQTREVAEFIRQDPAGYAATLVPMFLFAVGVVGAVSGTWAVHPGLVGMWVAYLLVTVLSRRARSLPTWFLHLFVLSHLAQMTVFFSHQYGFRLILPMYVAMMPVVGLGIAVPVAWIARRVAPLMPDLSTAAPLPTAARVSLLLVALAGTAVGLGAAGWSDRGPSRDDLAREAFYGLNGDAALATRQAARPDLARQADVTYFVGDDSRSTDVAYLRGLALPSPRWFDGARGLVLPRPDEQALYVLPDRAAADLAKRCLESPASSTRAADSATGAEMDLRIATDASGACGDPRLAVGAPFAETGRLLGLDAPASIEPGKTMDVLIGWQALTRPANRARPFVRLVDTRGRRWGQAESALYPSSSWRPGERAIGLARLEVDGALPPGSYRLEGGFTLGSGQDRTAEAGAWGAAGLTQAQAGPIRLVSRSTPLTPASLQIKIPLSASFDGVRLLGASLDRNDARAGERVRLTLFWQNAAGRLDDRRVGIALRDGSGTTLREWHGGPVDGTYPTAEWKPGEIVRDTWDLVLPASLPTGTTEIAVSLSPASGAGALTRVGTLAVQAIERRAAPPPESLADAGRFAGGAELSGFDLKTRRARPGDALDLTLFWRAAGPPLPDDLISVALVDETGRAVLLQDGEPAGGRRPSSGWTADEYVEDGWRLRLPRDLPRGRYRIAVGLATLAGGQPVPTEHGGTQVVLPAEIVVE